MALISTGVRLPRGGGNLQAGFSIDVDAHEAYKLLGAVEFATSGIRLAHFMNYVAHPIMQASIIRRFAANGGEGVPGGTWAPLEESTRRIRLAMGYDPDTPNERTGAMLSALLYTKQVGLDGAGGAFLMIPGTQIDPVLRSKLMVSEFGDVQGEDDMMPNALTVPRPILWVGRRDVAALMVALQLHIMGTINLMAGAIQGPPVP
jgi:hypothetical protein